MAFIPDKPMHLRFAFRNLNSTQYKTYAKQYYSAKAGVIRCVYTWMSGTGVMVVFSDED
jgi:hypothetical protein